MDIFFQQALAVVDPNMEVPVTLRDQNMALADPLGEEDIRLDHQNVQETGRDKKYDNKRWNFFFNDSGEIKA